MGRAGLEMQSRLWFHPTRRPVLPLLTTHNRADNNTSVPARGSNIASQAVQLGPLITGNSFLSSWSKEQ